MIMVELFPHVQNWMLLKLLPILLHGCQFSSSGLASSLVLQNQKTDSGKLTATHTVVADGIASVKELTKHIPHSFMFLMFFCNLKVISNIKSVDAHSRELHSP